MAQRQGKLDIKNRMLTQSKCLGNTKRGLKEVCSDLLNQYGNDTKSLQKVSQVTFLSVSTLQRICTLEETEHGDEYRPQADTLERVLRWAGASITFDQVAISNKYMPQPKKHED